jgi:two-component system cell cycle sensor histidine kinase/response regulator CckA
LQPHDSVALAVLNADSRYVHVDSRLCDMLGYTEEELLGRHFSDVTHPPDLQVSYSHHRRFREAPHQPVRWESRLLRKDGHPVWTRLTLARSPGHDGGDVLCLVDDVTDERNLAAERRRVDDQAHRNQKMEAVGRLAAGVSHELNNTLSVVLNHLDFAERRLDEGPGAIAPFLHAVRLAAQQSAGFVRKLMIFGRCDAAPPQVIDVRDLVISMEPRVRHLAGDAITVVVRTSGTPARAWLPPGHAEQLIANLVQNARDAMPRGGMLTIGVEATILGSNDVRRYNGLAAGRYVRLVVEDTGVGMAPETLARAFEPFFSTKPPGEGPGLGLSIVYGIAEEAGGHIQVDSAPGAGTRFELLFPATEVALTHESSAEQASWPRGKGERVLVVEDSAAVRDLTVLILRENGYDAWTVEGPREALQRLLNDQTPVDLLLTDLLMPGLSGTELATYVRSLRPRSRVLFMSGRGPEPIGGRRREAAFLQKPFDAETLLRSVRGALDHGEMN